MNEITIGDKVYISAKRAAEITGYARDYVGQLCREGHVDAKMVGRSWYVSEPSIRMHRFGGDSVEAAPAAPAATSPQAMAGAVAEDAPEAALLDAMLNEASRIAPPEPGTWEKPTYTPEKPELLPELEAPRLEELLPPAEETLTDMQAAWREWFDQRQAELQTPEIESPEVIDARNELNEEEKEEEKAEEESENEAPQAIAPEKDETDDDVQALVFRIPEEDEVSIPLHRIEEAPEEHFKASEGAEIVPIRTIAPTPVAPAIPAASVAQPTSLNMPSSMVHMDMARPPSDIPAISRPVSFEPEPTAQQGRIINERIIPAQRIQNQKGRKALKGISTGPNSRSSSSERTNAPIIALLVAVCVLSIAIAAIGTGYANRYLKTLPSKNNPVINFLVGTREFKR